MKKTFLAIATLVFLLTVILAINKQSNITSAQSAGNSFKLGLPINCTLGKDCFIMHYLDRDPSPAAIDFACGQLTYDTHNGTDFAIPDERAMAKGVAVKAVASGKVLRIRDGVPDIRVADQTDKSRVQGIECGNGVVIDHGNGWQSQYCHLRQGSVVVKPNTSVASGAVLGMVGESGLASFPHVHLTVRYQDKVVDPFVGTGSSQGCNVARQPLWQKPLEYVPTGLIRAGFASKQPEMAEIWQGQLAETTLAKNNPALLFWVQAFGVRQGDEEQFRLIAPDGKTVINSKQPLKSTHRVWLSYVGKKNSASQPLVPGVWRGEYRLVRGNKVLIESIREVQLR
ncbi:M23 family metallopeptidase [Phormidium sp. LEGE 05292]|uniref:M23 family metallopeptidase n=1 Tax=[Phormidium] sp. LEGE 05292 TaxID=767427 RepID=UPI00188250F8|nr:M23 family metallopeptidase [Phormidium sp. LEGE 05292]MBE9223936.1 M23 family metallopeptidase [Phormidium sp. LEGE 05292]